MLNDDNLQQIKEGRERVFDKIVKAKGALKLIT